MISRTPTTSEHAPRLPQNTLTEWRARRSRSLVGLGTNRRPTTMKTRPARAFTAPLSSSVPSAMWRALFLKEVFQPCETPSASHEDGGVPSRPRACCPQRERDRFDRAGRGGRLVGLPRRRAVVRGARGFPSSSSGAIFKDLGPAGAREKAQRLARLAAPLERLAEVHGRAAPR